MRLGAIIRRWRVIEEIPLKVLAAEIGINPSTLGRVEREENTDAQTFLKVLAWLTGKPDAEEEG